MKPVTVTLSSIATTAVGFGMAVGFVGLCEPRWDIFHSQIARGIVLVVTLLSWFTTLVSIPFVVRSKGYGWGIAASVALIVLAMHWRTSVPGMLLAATLVTLLPNANLPCAKIIGRSLVIFLTTATFLLLHEFGYRVYGAPYVVRGAPPSSEGWLKVTDIRYPDCFILSNDSLVRISPVEFSAALHHLSSNAFSELVFNVPLSELYVRPVTGAVDQFGWRVRVGNEYVDESSRFFPGRVYGYGESDLYAHLWSFPSSRRKIREFDNLTKGNPNKQGAIKLSREFERQLFSAFGAETVQRIGSVRTFGTPVHEFVLIDLWVSPISGNSDDRYRACVVRRKRTSEGWDSAEVYLIPELLDFPLMQAASDPAWETFLRERLHKLN